MKGQDRWKESVVVCKYEMWCCKPLHSRHQAKTTGVQHGGGQPSNRSYRRGREGRRRKQCLNWQILLAALRARAAHLAPCSWFLTVSSTACQPVASGAKRWTIRSAPSRAGWLWEGWARCPRAEGVSGSPSPRSDFLPPGICSVRDLRNTRRFLCGPGCVCTHTHGVGAVTEPQGQAVGWMVKVPCWKTCPGWPWGEGLGELLREGLGYNERGEHIQICGLPLGGAGLLPFFVAVFFFFFLPRVWFCLCASAVAPLVLAAATRRSRWGRRSSVVYASKIIA